ncbi:M23 family metallopeptidase [Tahibacter amnicola]|uniref:M23 family metallopeptidase n=1 Tax=Tahibacter amnicola TaxID=2976241 RepID=A0ABY6BMZ4_9GAMM|nr:M23 family metallopeptidase [Tahibacter amnicola]UXI69941.1 M23 family metallopeptidase [Tahibacter amnicola]
MKRPVEWALALAAATSPGAWADAGVIDLPNTVQQGQLVVGHVPAGSQVKVGDRTLAAGADGVIAFGIARDAPERLVVSVSLPRGQAVEHALAVTQRSYAIERVDGLPQRTVTPDPETEKRIAEEQARVAQARQRNDPRTDFLAGFARPAEGRISGVYGSQRVNNGIPKSPHMGLDIAVPTGTPVKAPAGGVVSFADPDLVLTGGTVLVDHGHGLTSAFAHLSRIDVVVGQAVAQGEVLGAAGATGRASGPHVHWGFNWFDVRLDPQLLPATAEKAAPKGGAASGPAGRRR